MDAREKKKLVNRIFRFDRSVNETASKAMMDPIHEPMYKEEMANHCLKALKLLGECVRVLEEEV